MQFAWPEVFATLRPPATISQPFGLIAASKKVDVLITVDRRMPFQQNLGGLDLALVILIAKPNRYPELKLLVPKTLLALETIKAGDVVSIS